MKKINITNTLIFVFAFLYLSIIISILLYQYNTFTLFNTQDIAIYNQSFWNTIHGQLFTNNTYGSNLSCHNTWFFFLLIPFYYFFPHPLTLFILKSLLLTASLIPLGLIAKEKLMTSRFNIILAMIFLFHPSILSQNFGPPHEISFAPFFLMFTFYFFIKKNFKYFIIFSLLSLSIKEQISAAIFMFGILAFIRKYDKKWIFSSFILGISWFLFSIISLSMFKKVFPASYEPAWIIAYVKNIVSGKNPQLLKFMNIKNFYWTGFYLKSFLVNLGLFPLLSASSILAIPEALLNLLLANTAVITPLRHYNITVSCFLFCAFIEGLAKLKISNKVMTIVLTTILAMNLYMIKSQQFFFNNNINTARQDSIKKAISFIPDNASVTSDREFAPQLSSRTDLYIRELKPGILTDYLIADISKSFDIQTAKYDLIFHENSIATYKKSRSEN